MSLRQSAYISLPSAQKLFKLGENVSGIWVKLHDFDQAGKYAKRSMQNSDPPYEAIRHRRELNPNLFAWMEIEKWAAFVVLSLNHHRARF
jgi:lipoprotein-releasing system permease protein